MVVPAQRSFPLDRAWLIPLLILALAVGSMASFSFYILHSAFDRDLEQKAVGLAEGIVQQLLRTPAADRQQMIQTAFTNELFSDPTVEMVAFCDTASLKYVYARRSENIPTPAWTLDQVRSFARPEITRNESDTSISLTVPFIANRRLLAFTYVQLNKAALTAAFWQKEGPLLYKVIIFSSTLVILLSVLALLAYWSRVRLSTTQIRAQLAQQGMIAERGLTAAVLAHEIRNPLAALRFQLHSLRRTSDPERIAQTADTIDGELLRIQTLVTDYLEHEKAATLRSQPVDLYRACRDLQMLLNELLRSTGTRLTIIAPQSPVRAACDPHALRQVLLNIVLNAQQAMGRLGQITISIGTENNQAVLSISDTGPGLPDSVKENLFKPFQSTKVEGTGIGLALVKRFADNFGGSVTVDTSSNGTTFKLTLPMADVPAQING
jgi:signal transduction histidine kinase